MNIKQLIKEEYYTIISNNINEDWFHGTPDARELEKEGGFQERTIVTTYISDLSKYNSLTSEMHKAKNDGNEDRYFELLDKIPKYKKQYKYIKPVFLTDEYSVAKSYADPHRAYDYQKAEEKVIEVDVNCNNIVKINATGEKFSEISHNRIIRGFVESNIPEEKIVELIKMFTFASNRKQLKTDDVGAIAHWLNFDCVDFIGVLDSYNVGKTKSTVKMVLNPKNIKIKH